MKKIRNFFTYLGVIKRQLFYLLFLVLLVSVNTHVYYRSFDRVARKKESLVTEEIKVVEEQQTAEPSEEQKKEQTTGTAPPAKRESAQGGLQTSSGGSSATGNSPVEPDDSFNTVAFYADSQSDTDAEDQNHLRVVSYIMNSGASTVFHAGDLLEDGTVESLARFNAVTASMRASKGFYSAQGNNERNSSVYFNNFNYPGNEHWYSVNIGNLHMVVLDNYASSIAVGSEQYNWLAADLQSAASQQGITGVMFHYPIYGAGGDTKGMIPTVVPLFKNYGVDFVVSGHEHGYRNNLVDGIRYFICSGQPSIGYLTAKVYSNRVDIISRNSNNGVIDTVSINNR